MQQVDEAKVKALESIFGGQDITASVIRTVLSSNDNKFDDTVDSLLNMTTSAEDSAPAKQNPLDAELDEDALLDKKEREKIKTLETMFGADLSNSVIYTVLESNRGELVDTVDTLLNMTSKDINPHFEVGNSKEADNRKEAERVKQQEELKNYEDFKKLQIKLQEEEARAMKEQAKQQARKDEEESIRKNEEALRCKVMVEEQDRLFREYEAQKRIEAEKKMSEAQKKIETARKEAEAQKKTEADKNEAEAQKKIEAAKKAAEAQKKIEAEKKAAEAEKRARERARKTAEEEAWKAAKLAEEQAVSRERELLKKEQERLQRAWEERLKELQTEEEKIRVADALRREEEEKRKEELRKQEERLKAKALEEEKRIALLRDTEAKRLEERRKQLEEEAKRTERQTAEALARSQQELKRAKEMRKAEENMRLEAEERAYRFKLEEEELARVRRIEEERKVGRARMELEEEMQALQKQKDALQAMLRAQQAEVARQEADKKRLLEEREREERERREEQERLQREELEAKKLEEALKALLLQQQQEQEEARRVEEERRLRMAEEEAREHARLVEEAAREEVRRVEEERVLAIRRREEEAEAVAVAEERAKKEQYDLMAASAVFIPPKANQSSDEGKISVTASVAGDVVTCTWDLPEGNAAATNWLGLYPVHQPVNTKKYVQFVYTNGASTGQHVFRGVTPGHYEVRFFATRGYEHAARSSRIRVGPSATLMSQVQGEHLLVYYTLDPISATPTREWLGVYEKTQRRNKVYLSTAYGNAEGRVMMRAPRTPGVYEVRLFASGAVYNDQARAEFTVEDNDCVNVEPSSLMAGANVTISWIIRTVEPASGDWVGLYRADEPNNSNYLSCTYTNGASVGTVTVQAPKEVGVYEFRMFARAKGKYVTFRTSSPLTVV